MMIRNLIATFALLMLAACGNDEMQYLVESKPSDLRVNARVHTLLVRTVSLPTYAADQKIMVQGAGGVVTTEDFGLWADEPERATTLSVSRNLNAMTSAHVAPEPWPLPEPPQGVLDIRVETFIATTENTFRMSGQYFMGSEIPDPIDSFDPDVAPKILAAPLRDTSKLFDISIPLAVRSPSAIAAAQTAAVTQLSEQIARDLAR